MRHCGENMNKSKVCVYWCDIGNIQYTDDEILQCNRITGLTNPKYSRTIDLFRHITGLLLAEWGNTQFVNAPKITQIRETNKIKRGKNNKPYFESDDNRKFNISHSGDLVVCAISDCEVGIDVEIIAKTIQQLMENICNEEEIDWLNNQASVDEQYRLWTYKESYLKCTGDGIGKIRKTISMINNGKLITKYRNYCFQKLYLRDGYVATVCTEKLMEAYYIEEVDIACLKQVLKMKVV